MTSPEPDRTSTRASGSGGNDQLMMNERHLRAAIDAALSWRQLVEYGGPAPGGGTWPDMALIATIGVLREWGIEPDRGEVLDLFIATAVELALDRLSPRIPVEVQDRMLAPLPPDRPSTSGKGVVGYAASKGFSKIRRCPRCRTEIYTVSKGALASAPSLPRPLWVTLEGKAPPGADGVIDIRPAPIHDHAGQRPGHVDADGVGWPQRDIETPYRPPITVRCHGGRRTLPQDQRGAERCGAVIRIDELGEPHEVDGPTTGT
jgi:hypothetical protein